MSLLRLSHIEARNMMLAAQGLHRRPEKRATKHSVLQTIRRMCALQIDTIHVVARSPYFVLWSRLGNYEPCWLDELLAEGKLFEYWSHEACFLPIEDYALYRQRMIAPGASGWKYSHEWISKHTIEIDKVLSAIRERGAMRSSDFARTDGKKGGGWWDWKPEKRALEMLFTAGKLMIARRHNFQRVYDLRERVLPAWNDSHLPSADEVHRTLVLKTVRALGITKASWTADYFRLNKRDTEAVTRRLGEEKELLTVQVEEWKEPAYVHPANRGLIKAATSGLIHCELTTLLSPFDPVVWDRTRAREMFDFDYRIECYTPALKRRYGYFTLPILHRGALIGRIDAKAHRRESRFEIKAIHLEAGVKMTDALIADVARAVRECAVWHKAPEVFVSSSDPLELAALLRLHLA